MLTINCSANVSRFLSSLNRSEGSAQPRVEPLVARGLMVASDQELQELTDSGSVLKLSFLSEKQSVNLILSTDSVAFRVASGISDEQNTRGNDEMIRESGLLCKNKKDYVWENHL